MGSFVVLILLEIIENQWDSMQDRNTVVNGLLGKLFSEDMSGRCKEEVVFSTHKGGFECMELCFETRQEPGKNLQVCIRRGQQG